MAATFPSSYHLILVEPTAPGSAPSAPEGWERALGHHAQVLARRRGPRTLVAALSGSPRPDLWAAWAQAQGLRITLSGPQEAGTPSARAWAELRWAALGRWAAPAPVVPFDDTPPSDQDVDEADRFVLRVQSLVRTGDPEALVSYLGPGLETLTRGPGGTSRLRLAASFLRSRFVDPYPALAQGRLWRVSERWETLDSLGAWAEALGRYLVVLQRRLKPEASDPVMAKVLEFTRASVDSDLSMALVANHFSMNYSRFSQRFKASTGVGFQEYVKKLKIERSLELLKSSPLRIYEIARQSGYQNTKYFLKVFKEQTGLSPTEFRQAAAL